MTQSVSWTDSQYRRLKELGAEETLLTVTYQTTGKRDKEFQAIDKKRSRKEKDKLSRLLENGGNTQLGTLTEKVLQMLSSEGFSRVTTPTVITRHALARMTIDSDHPLFNQVYWINDKQCLRPMLAPNLYSLMIDFSRLKQRPIRFFEIGSCFRKESDGSRHSSEFTMLNLVEMGLPLEERSQRLTELATRIAKTAGLPDYRFEEESSKVYGTTIDLISGPGNVEVASGAMGPHPLDGHWGIRENWIGMGFGLERLLMIANGDTSISKWCKSLTYHNGIRLKI